MNVAWDLCWGGGRSTKHCVFPGKVAAAGGEAARTRGSCGPFVLTCDWFLSGVLQRAVAIRIVMAA